MSNFDMIARVYIEDTDAGGIVYYANYLRFMERARTEFFRHLGYLKPALFDGFQFVVRDVSVRYLKPAFLDDEINVSVVLRDVSKFAFEMNQEIHRFDERLVSGFVKSVCVEEKTKRLTKMPDQLFELLKSHSIQ